MFYHKNIFKIFAAFCFVPGLWCIKDAPAILVNLSKAGINIPDDTVIIMGVMLIALSIVFWLVSAFYWIQNNWRNIMIGPLLLAFACIIGLIVSVIWWQHLIPKPRDTLIISEIFPPDRGVGHVGNLILNVTNTFSTTAKDVKLKIDKIKVTHQGGKMLWYTEPNISLPLLSGQEESSSINTNDSEDFLLASFGAIPLTPEDKAENPHKIGYEYIKIANYEGQTIQEGQTVFVSTTARSPSLGDHFSKVFKIEVKQGGGISGPSEVQERIAWGK